jgi:phosphoglycerate dehydrogenase-like enzyme
LGARRLPLFALPNVILSPHSAGLSKEAAIRMAISTSRNALAHRRQARTSIIVNGPRPLVDGTVWRCEYWC